jgi:sugar/nucleoside kinase (ribokinase family)
MKSAPEVIGIGAAICDVVVFVPKLPSPEEKIKALKSFPPAAAGVALDAITQTSRLGLKSGFIGKIADDYKGRLFLNQLERDNIDISRTIMVKGARNAVCWVIVDQEGRRFHIMHPMGEMGYITPEEIAESADYIGNAKFCHTEILQMPLSPMIKAAEIAKESGCLVSFDLDINPSYIYNWNYGTEKDLMRMIELTDVLKPCKDAVAGLSNEDDMRKAAEAILEYGPKIVAITLGKQGCAVAHRVEGKIRSFIAPGIISEKTVDTTGAGDSFSGGLMYGILKRWDIKKTATFANACASAKTTRIGARNMPGMDEVKSLIKDPRFFEARSGV